MEISNLLKKVFLTHESVSVGNFGMLLVKEVSAQIKGNEIIPPTKKVSFLSKIEDNAVPLEKALVDVGLQEADANDFVKNMSAKLTSVKEKGEKYEIEDIGYFFKDEKGFLQFQCDDDFNLLPEAIGLSSVKVTKTVNVSKSKKGKKTKSDKTVKASDVKLTYATKQKKEKKVKDKEKSKKLTKSLLIALPVVLILVLLGLFHKPIIDKAKDVFKKSGKENVTQVDTQQNNVVTNDTNVSDVEPQLGNDEEYKNLLDAHISNMADVYLGENYKKFYVIVGSYSAKQNANDYAKQLRNMGYSPVIIDGSTEHKYFRVSLGGYDTADNLITDYKQYTSRFGKEIWILVNRKK